MGNSIHPNSLANLRSRAKDYEAEKKERRVTVTNEGWDGAKEAIKAAGFSSVSQFLEELGRGRATAAQLGDKSKLE